MFSGFAVHIQQKVILNWMHHLSSCPCPLSHTAWMLLCSPKCMTHSALGRHCRVQLFILSFSVNPPTEPLWTSSVSMHVSWKQYNSPGLFCLLLAWLLKSSVVALYWEKWSVRLLAACLLSCLKKLQGRNACLLVFYHVNYLPFDQCFPSLWTLLVFCKTKKIDEILKPKTKQEQEWPWSVNHCSTAPLLLTCAGEARHCSFLLPGDTWASVSQNSPFDMHLPIFTGRFSQGWRKGTRLRYEQLRRTHPSAIRSFRKIIFHSNKFLYRLKRPGSVAQVPVHTSSLHQGQLARRC